MNNSKHFKKSATLFNTAQPSEASLSKPAGKTLWEKLMPKDSFSAETTQQAVQAQPEPNWSDTNRAAAPEKSYKNKQTYALNNIAAIANDGSGKLADAAETDALATSITAAPSHPLPWKTIGSTLALSGIGVAASAGRGSSKAQPNKSAQATENIVPTPSKQTGPYSAVTVANTRTSGKGGTAPDTASGSKQNPAVEAPQTQPAAHVVSDKGGSSHDAASGNKQNPAVEAPQTQPASPDASGKGGTAPDTASGSKQNPAVEAQTQPAAPVVSDAATAQYPLAETDQNTTVTETSVIEPVPEVRPIASNDANTSTLAATSDAPLNAQAQYIANNIPGSANYIVVSNMSDAAAAASDSNLTHVLVSDGSHFALFSKGDTAGHLTVDWNGATWGARFTEYVPVSAFIGDGSDKDITSALQNALNLASTLKLGVEMPQDGDYAISNSITIKPGVSFLHGNHSDISVQSTGSSIYALRLTSGNADARFDLSDLTIDMNSLGKTYALWGEDVSGIDIHGIQIVDASHTAVLLRSLSQGSKDVTISDSIFQLNWDSSVTGMYHGIEVNNATKKQAKTYTGSNAFWQQYLETGTIPEKAFDVSGIKITGNQISGGYYGISFSGVANSEISDNLISNNVRSISLQNHSSGNQISDNYLTGQLSSAVHLAYDSDGNTVTGNKVTTDTAIGQGLFQAYQDSDNNYFANNSVEILGNNMPRWGFYSGSDSDNNSFTDNIISGRIQKTVFGTEAIWDYHSANAQGTQPSAYMSSILGTASNPIYYNGGIGSVSNITVDGNIVDPGYRPTPILYAGADVSTGYDGNQNIVGGINGLTYTGNTVFGKDKLDFTDMLRIHENGGATVSNLVDVGNQILDGSQAGHQTGTATDNVFFVDSDKDTINDPSSVDNDQVYSSVSYRLPESVENLMLIGSTALIGTGNSGHNTIIGNAYDNVLSGGGGNDKLYGGWGNDILTGGAGSDTFVFDSFLKNGNVGQITDFTVGTDIIGLSSVIFGSPSGDDWFAPSIDQISSRTTVFQDGNGLYYDADGSGSHFSPIRFAELNTSEQLNVTSFQIL